MPMAYQIGMATRIGTRIPEPCEAGEEREEVAAEAVVVLARLNIPDSRTPMRRNSRKPSRRR